MLEQKPSRFQEQSYRGAKRRMGRTLAAAVIGNIALETGIVAAVGSGRVVEGAIAAVAGATILGHELVVNHRRGR